MTHPAIRSVAVAAASPLAVGALALAWPGTARAAGFQNWTQSPSALGMGSMGTANPDEINASFYNAAATARREGIELYIGGTLLAPRAEYQSLDGSDEATTTTRFFLPPSAHLGYAHKTSDAGTFAGSIGLAFPYGLGVTWPDDWRGDAIIVSQDLQAASINPNFAYKFPGLDLSIAAGPQIYRASVALERDIVLRDDREVRVDIGGTGWGFAGSAALMYKPIESLTIGVNYKGAADLDFSAEGDFRGAEGTPFEQTFVDQPGSAVIQIPHALTVGVGWSIDRLFLGLDAVYTAWSRYDQVDLKFSEPCREGSITCDPSVDETDPPTTSIINNYEDSIALRFGARYMVTDALALRVGGAYDFAAAPERFVSPSLPDADRASLNGGFGYQWNELRIDAGYGFVRSLELQITPETGNPFTGVYDSRIHVASVGLSYGY